MTNFQNLFFGPLNSDACIYFYFVTAFFLFLLILALFAGIALVIKRPSVINFKTGLHALLIFFNIFLAYFVNRLLYTICNKTLA